MTQYFNDNGDFEYTAKDFQKMEIRTTCEFHVALNGSLIGPDSVNSRFLRLSLAPDDEIAVNCSERYSIMVKDLPNRAETPDPDSLVETIEADELNMYDRLRNEMLGKLNQIAEQQQSDTFEDDNDFDWEEHDETPLTPYEYVEMQEEKLPEPDPQPEPESPTIQQEPDSTQSDPVAPTL